MTPVDPSSFDAWIYALLILVDVSFALETFYAVVFYRVVGEHTIGDDAVWFAEKNNPVFQKVVRITALCNVPIVIFLVVFLFQVVL